MATNNYLSGPVINMTLSAIPKSSTTTYAPNVVSVQPTIKPSLPKVAGPLEEDVICWDLETTGINPWEDILLIGSFWNLQESKTTLTTFASWDEEEVTRDIAEYLNSYDEFSMTGYNTAFDIRHLTSRLMAFQVPCPPFLAAKHYDTMDLLKKGTAQYVYSSQASGSLEDWIVYFYDEEKPYTIEECFAALREKNMEPLIIRNRWDVATEGDVYLLFRYIETGQIQTVGITKPTERQRTEESKEGIVVVPCSVCRTLNEYDLKNTSQTCYLCQSTIQRPSIEDALIEITREFIPPAESKSSKKSGSTA